MKRSALLAAGALLAPPLTAQSLTQVLGPPVTTHTLDTPTFVTSWPGNSKLLVVVERGAGKVTLWDTGSPDQVPPTILDLSNEAWIPTSFGEFVGVTSVAFHPDFLRDPSKRFLYARYNEQGPPTTTTWVKRWLVPPGMTKVDPATEFVIYTWPTLTTLHASGTIHFDTRPLLPPLGSRLLYEPMPDDANVGDCCEAARGQGVSGPSDLSQLITINVDANPPLVWSSATGLRNPFGFSVDRGDASTGQGRGDVWIGDVGGSNTGSIIRWTPTAVFHNYGWPWMTGNGQVGWSFQPATAMTTCGAQPPAQCGETMPPPAYTAPYVVFSDIAEFFGAHDALIGGYVYRNSSIPALTGRYVFATYGTLGRRIYHMASTSGAGIPPVNITGPLGLGGWTGQQRIHGLGQDANGEPYVIRVDESAGMTSNGTVLRINP